MKWVTVHKVIGALALLIIGCLIVVDLLLGQDKSGLHIFEGNFVFLLLIALFYAICITGFVAGYRYASIGSKKSNLFWVSIVSTILVSALTVPMSFDYIKNWLSPPTKSIFDGLDLFGISENRKNLLHYQSTLFAILSLLHIASVCILIRLRKLFNAAET